MNLTKALKKKKRLIGDVEKAFQRFMKNNSYDEKKKPTYEPEEQYELWKKLTQDLIDLKVKIQIANGPILSKIYRLSECKSIIEKVRRIPTLSGEVDKNEYGEVPKIITFKAFIDDLQRDKMIENLEDEIEEIQSQIEEFNAKTQIED